LNERVALLQQEVGKLEQALEVKQEALSASEAANADNQRELRAAHDDLEAAELRADTAERKLSSQSTSLKSAQSDLEDLRVTLRDAEDRISILENELEETKTALVRAERDLINTSFEAFQSDLQKKLDLAHREIGNLKHQLASPAYHATAVGADCRDMEIRNLKSSNHELETRVSQLKRQALLGGGGRGNGVTHSVVAAAGTGTPEKSVRFDSVQGMKTPRSATQMLGSVSPRKCLC
jgi:chromosome segregation ATPase